MLYNVVRFAFFLIILGLGFLLLKRLKATRKLFIIVPLSILWLGLFLTSFSFPVENLFINFKSPEEVFHYTKIGRIEDIVYGNDSCMIYYFTGTNPYSIYIPKTAIGYKIPNLFTFRIVSTRTNAHGTFQVFNVIDTNDYYIWGGMISSENDTHIFDGNGNTIGTFKRIEDKGIAYSLYAYVHDLPDGAYTLINGEKVLIAN